MAIVQQSPPPKPPTPRPKTGTGLWLFALHAISSICFVDWFRCFNLACSRPILFVFAPATRPCFWTASDSDCPRSGLLLASITAGHKLSLWLHLPHWFLLAFWVLFGLTATDCEGLFPFCLQFNISFFKKDYIWHSMNVCCIWVQRRTLTSFRV